MVQPLIQLPDWGAFRKVPPQDDWEALGRLARKDAATHHAELDALLTRCRHVNPNGRGPDGTPFLTEVLKGWRAALETHGGKEDGIVSGSCAKIHRRNS